MKQWERFEEYLTEYPLVRFTNQQIATDLGISARDATYLIKAYIVEQVKPDGRTKFVLTRKGRTTNAVWHAGDRAVDARRLRDQTVDDFYNRIDRYVAPTLDRMRQRNPRAARAVTDVLEDIRDGLEVLAGVVDRQG